MDIITLVKEIDNTNIIILLESQDFIVKVSLSDFKDNIDSWLKEHPHLKEDKKLLDILLRQTKSNKRQTYSYHCGFLCGSGGRRFYVNDILILEVMDWIS